MSEKDQHGSTQDIKDEVNWGKVFREKTLWVAIGILSFIGSSIGTFVTEFLKKYQLTSAETEKLSYACKDAFFESPIAPISAEDFYSYLNNLRFGKPSDKGLQERYAMATGPTGDIAVSPDVYESAKIYSEVSKERLEEFKNSKYLKEISNLEITRAIDIVTKEWTSTIDSGSRFKLCDNNPKEKCTYSFDLPQNIDEYYSNLAKISHILDLCKKSKLNFSDVEKMFDAK